jgi:hypothetical protein
MSTIIRGIRNAVNQAADLPKVNNTLLDTDLVIPISAGQLVTGTIKAWFTLAGAASGVQFELLSPAGVADYKLTWQINDTQTPAVDTDVLLAQAAFSSALANAGNYYAEINFSILNGATAGNLTLQFAQKTTDAAAATLLKNSILISLLLAN